MLSYTYPHRIPSTWNNLQHINNNAICTLWLKYYQVSVDTTLTMFYAKLNLPSRNRLTLSYILLYIINSAVASTLFVKISSSYIKMVYLALPRIS